ncbi:MAG: hypothetical protein J1F60_07650 [Oscillospiraceae bacterium]|nr:hypothetical protein [Oscillospiraceae bacterium]
MKWIFSGLILLSVVIGFARGDASSVSNAAVSACSEAVALCITLCGMICLWSGIMRVAQSSGLTEIVAKALSPVLRLLFKGISPKGEAMQYIILNITANLLGLGNASTPFGIAAMKALEKEEKSGEKATDNMIVFVVLNTASLQLIPTTVAALRLQHGSAAPMEILPAVWAVSVINAVLTVSAAKVMGALSRRRSGGVTA